MSTISKLNPSMREARTRRALVIEQTRALLSRVSSMRDSIDLQAMIKDLEKVRKASWAPGRWKERAFRAILNRVKVASV